MAESKPPFILEQLEEALEERQNPDRRKSEAHVTTEEERRKQDRRKGTP